MKSHRPISNHPFNRLFIANNFYLSRNLSALKTLVQLTCIRSIKIDFNKKTLLLLTTSNQLIKLLKSHRFRRRQCRTSKFSATTNFQSTPTAAPEWPQRQPPSRVVRPRQTRRPSPLFPLTAKASFSSAEVRGQLCTTARSRRKKEVSRTEARRVPSSAEVFPQALLPRAQPRTILR